MEAKFVTHDNPAIVSERNHIARADLTPFGFPGTYEQLWLRPLGGELYQLTCIPFQAYGLSLGDRVRLDPDRTFVSALIERSGHRTLRILLEPADESHDLEAARDVLRSATARLGLLAEWNGDRYVAIDVPDNSQIEELIRVAKGYVDDGKAYWEWSEARPFTSV